MTEDFHAVCSSKKFHKRESKFAKRMVEACKIGCNSVLKPLDKRLMSFHMGFVLGRDSLYEKCQPSTNISNLSRAASKIIEKAPAEKAKVEQSNTIKP